MKYTPLVLLLASCAWDQPYVNQPIGIANRPDPAAQVIMQCDALGLRSLEASRLCILRGMDRQAVYPQQGTIAHVPLIPYPYPPLAPGGSANPYGYSIQRGY